MAWFALGLYFLGLVTTLGVRSWLRYRATGDSGHRHSQAAPSSPEWWAQVLWGAGVLLSAAALTLTATGILAPISGLGHPLIQGVGLVAALAGFAVVLAAQQTMGASWRIGVDKAERTELVTHGMFGRVRNPIFTAMIAASGGLTLMAPSWLQLVALACLVAGIELQVRVVEERYLARTHGAVYATYAAKVGRFLPVIGRISSVRSHPSTEL